MVSKEKRREQRREAQRRYRKTRKGKATDARYWKSDAGKKTRVRYTKSWRIRNRLKQAAHNAVTYALSIGRIKKGGCEMCGSTKVVAHHDDYLKPLKVKWLCRKHHNEIHCLPRYTQRRLSSSS